MKATFQLAVLTPANLHLMHASTDLSSAVEVLSIPLAEGSGEREVLGSMMF